jgi:hypothetical protein
MPQAKAQSGLGTRGLAGPDLDSLDGLTDVDPSCAWSGQEDCGRSVLSSPDQGLAAAVFACNQLQPLQVLQVLHT